jgi:hypothetical protein
MRLIMYRGRHLRGFGKRPLGRAKSMSKTERFHLAHSSNLDGTDLLALLARLWLQIDCAAMRRRVASERSVKFGPTFRLDRQACGVADWNSRPFC